METIREGFVAIRANEMGEWIDSSSFSLLAELVETNIRQSEKDTPYWNKANPVLRVVPAKIVVTE